jgi:hypothetical protein
MSALEITGRTRKPWSKKINPVWWLLNDDDPRPPRAYMPDKPSWWRQAAWWLRNPFHNLFFYVIGVADRDYTVVGEEPLRAVDWIDARQHGIERHGFKYSVIHLRCGLRLPCVSYAGRWVKWYVGWRWFGAFGAKFNLLGSRIQGV